MTERDEAPPGESIVQEVARLNARVAELEADLADTVDRPARGTGLWVGPSGSLYVLDPSTTHKENAARWLPWDRRILGATCAYLTEVMHAADAYAAELEDRKRNM